MDMRIGIFNPCFHLVSILVQNITIQPRHTRAAGHRGEPRGGRSRNKYKNISRRRQIIRAMATVDRYIIYINHKVTGDTLII